MSSSAPPPTTGTARSSAAARRRARNRPLVQIAAAAVVALAVVIVGSQLLSERAATREAIADARATTELLATTVVEPALSQAVVRKESAAVDRFDRVALNSIVVGDVRRMKIWDETGRIVYSDQTELIGERFDLDDDELGILLNGGSDAGVSDLSEPENRFETDSDRLLEVYTQVWSRQGTPLLFEAYYDYDDVARRSGEVLDAFRPITLAGLLVFAALAVPLVWALTRRLDTAAAEREHFLLTAVEASDAERRRIARDLHDGVVQDLAGISFAASATARELSDRPDVAQRLEALGVGVRNSLRALRSLLVDIYPPDLRTEGLAAALDDLVAPLLAAGVNVELEVAATDDVDEATVALVWRVAQEAVRNAARHSSARRLRVAVTRPPGLVVLEVADDGIGFDPDVAPSGEHLGLRGLRDLVADAGGRLDVRSTAGHGTTVRMEAAL